jgi:SSS family solute:Na+ symporter
LISAQLYIYLQSVQAYISPPIAACFIFGILWPRLNGTGAISSLLTGFGLGAVRFVFEILDKSHHFSSPLLRGLLDINFLHYAILMFVICAAVLILVSLQTEAPEPWRLAGMTFATVNEKLQTTPVGIPEAAYKPKPETATEHRINVVASLALIALVVFLWIYFR